MAVMDVVAVVRACVRCAVPPPPCSPMCPAASYRGHALCVLHLLLQPMPPLACLPPSPAVSSAEGLARLQPMTKTSSSCGACCTTYTRECSPWSARAAAADPGGACLWEACLWGACLWEACVHLSYTAQYHAWCGAMWSDPHICPPGWTLFFPAAITCPAPTWCATPPTPYLHLPPRSSPLPLQV